MPRLFNVVRIAVFTSALVFAIVVLGIAAWLNSILESSNLTRFVTLALVVSIVTLICAPALLLFGSLRKDRLITQTRVELVLTATMGILWVVLALFLSTQPVPDVECPLDDENESYDFTTDEFHAQYHAIQALAVLALIVLCGWAIFLFTLAMRHSMAGRELVWTARVTTAPWFSFSSPPPKQSSSEEKLTRLPVPVSTTSRRRRGHKHHFSTPGFFHRGTTDPKEVKPLTRNDSDRSATTQTSGVVTPGLTGGTPLGHSRSRSEPVARFAPAPPVASALATSRRARPPIRTPSADTSRPPISRPTGQTRNATRIAPAVPPSSLKPPPPLFADERKLTTGMPRVYAPTPVQSNFGGPSPYESTAAVNSSIPAARRFANSTSATADAGRPRRR